MTGVSGAAACADASTSRAQVLPGPALVAGLASRDVTVLDDSDLLDTIADWDRVASWVAAQQLAATAELARRPARIQTTADDPAAVRAGYGPVGERVREFVDDELAARLRVSRFVASRRVELGCALARLPVTRRALAEGRYDVQRARVVVDEVAVLDRTTAREVEATVVERGERESAARLRTRVRRAVLAADPVAAAARVERARETRSVGICPRPDGMAGLFALLPAPDALTVETVVTAAARSLKAALPAGDATTLEQLRADAFLAPFAKALVTGVLDGADPVRLGQHRGERAAVQVTVAASTLLGLDDAPATLAGYGPVTAQVARGLAPDARWRRILTDPRSGTVLDVGTTVYRPPAPIARHVEARDVTCRFPGCARRAQACDLDHVVAFPDGPTAAHNLVALCRRHHRLKQSRAVQVNREADGTVRWTMPTGHVHTVEPPAVGPVGPVGPVTPGDSEPDHGPPDVPQGRSP